MDERVIDVICDGHSAKNCAIKLNGVFCDGFKTDALIGVFSHFHDDHIQSLLKCISSYDVLITHPITFEGINAIKSGMRHRQQWITQDYDTAYKFDDGIVRLLKANHIPGSSQVYVESDGKTMLYSGDFSYPDVQIRQADYLVLDSTHGDPWHDGKTDRRSVKNRMFEHVQEKMESNTNVVIQASSGTLQEIVRHFEIVYGKKLPAEITFVMEEKQRAVLHSIYKDEVTEFRNIIEYKSADFWNVVSSKKKCVIFSTQMEILDEELRDFYKIFVDRYVFSREPIMPLEDGDGQRFNLAAHASIDGIYQYIESVNPKYVITDNSRSGYGRQLAKLISQKFPDIKAEHRPS